MSVRLRKNQRPRCCLQKGSSRLCCLLNYSCTDSIFYSHAMCVILCECLRHELCRLLRLLGGFLRCLLTERAGARYEVLVCRASDVTAWQPYALLRALGRESERGDRRNRRFLGESGFGCPLSQISIISIYFLLFYNYSHSTSCPFLIREGAIGVGLLCLFYAFSRIMRYLHKKKPRFTILFANLGKMCYLCADISHIRDYHHNYKPTLNYQTMYNKKRAKCKDFTYYCEVSYKFDEVLDYLQHQFPVMMRSELCSITSVICNQYAETGVLFFESVSRRGDMSLVSSHRLKFLHKDSGSVCLWWRSYHPHVLQLSSNL